MADRPVNDQELRRAVKEAYALRAKRWEYDNTWHYERDACALFRRSPIEVVHLLVRIIGYESLMDHKIETSSGEAWVQKSKNKSVDFWDAEVLALAAARWWRVDLLKPPVEELTRRRHQHRKAAEGGGGGWQIGR